jgi:membrane protein insertase Oxa1/YidC/SpoIIIJ
MTKSKKIQEITNKILKLKELGPSVKSKHTIQKLQQELGKLIKDEA